MNDRGRLWMISRGYPPQDGGVQAYARATAERYAALGWAVTMFTASPAGPRRLTAAGLTLHDVGLASKLRVQARLAAAVAGAWRRAARPRVIHACTWRAAIPALLLPAPLIVTVHGREIGRPRGAAFVMMRLVLRRACRIVAVSGTTRALLLKRLPHLADKCIVAFNGTTIPAAPRPGHAAEAAPTLLTVCRLVPRKNLPAAIEAVARIAERHPTLTYRIAGRGSEEASLRRHIAAHGIGRQVALLGYVAPDALDALHAAADIFLHPQIALEGGDEVEGFGLSVADAMAHGLVCIVGREGGPAELIEHGVTGFVVDGRAADVIAALLERLIADPPLRRAIGARARAAATATLCWSKHCTACVAGTPALEEGA